MQRAKCRGADIKTVKINRSDIINFGFILFFLRYTHYFSKKKMPNK